MHTTAKTLYKTEDLSVQGSVCFMVRAAFDGVTEGDISPEKCTTSTENTLGFNGLRLLAPNRDGSMTLVWTKIKSNDVSYNIFKRKSEEKWDFAIPAWTTRDSSYKVPASAFGESACYLVRFQGKELATDQNTKELCSNKESLADFSGIASASSPQEGVVEITWTLSKNPNVNEYHLYKDNAFTSLAGTADKTSSSFTLTGLTPGELVRVGVRVADASGREDANTKTISVKVKCAATCNTPPEKPESPVLTLIPPGTNGGSAICSVVYKDVDADGTNVVPTFHFFNAKDPETPRLSMTVDSGVKSAIYLLKNLQDTGSIATADVRNDTLYCTISLSDGIATVVSAPSANPMRIANAAPEIKNTENKTIGESERLSFNIGAIDPDGDALTLACVSGCPTGMALDITAGAISWTPSFGQAGVYNPVFSASDGLVSVTKAIQIAVTHTNRVPIFSDVLAKSIERQSTLSFTVSAVDPDGSSVTYSCKDPCPVGLTINANSGVVHWTPTGNQVGLFQVVLAASDGSGEGAVTVPVTVRSVNHAPVLSVIPAQNINEMQTLTFSLVASESDGDVIAYRCASFCPTGLWVNPASGSVQWTPTYLQAGNYAVTFEASDGDKTDTKSATITVIDVNRPPIAMATLTAPNPAYNDSTFLCLSTGSTDPDLDDVNGLSISYKWLADGSDIIGATQAQLTLQAIGGLYNGAAIRCEVGISDGKVFTPVTARSLPVTLINRTPTARGVISPAAPRRTDTLTCNTNTASDPDGDPLSFTYSWKQDSVLIAGQTAATLPSAVLVNHTTYICLVSANDGHGGVSSAAAVDVVIQNQAPTLAAIANQTVNEAQSISFALVGADADNDVLTYRCSANCPTGLNVTAGGTVSWSPAYGQAGVYAVTFEATDAVDVAIQVASITVVKVNRPPLPQATLTAPSPAYNDSTLLCSSFGTTDSDPEDVNSLVISYKWLADGVEIAGATQAQLTLLASGGLYNGAAIRCEVGVSDGHVASPVTAQSAAVTLQNRAPTARAVITPATPHRSDTLTCGTNTSSDPDGDSLSFTYVWNQNGSVIAGQTAATLPAAGLVSHGTYSCVVTANDAHSGTNSVNSADVVVRNQAPTLAAISSQTVNEGQTLSFVLAGTDADNDALTYRCSAGCPTGLSVTSGGSVSWLPAFGQAGVYNITFEVSDAVDVATQVASITVVHVNRPPVPQAILIAPSPLYNNGSLTCSSAGTIDPDAADVAYVSTHISYKWLANGSYIAGQTDTQLTLPGAVGMYVGQTIQCEVTSTDGQAGSPVTALSLGVVVANRNPTVVAAVNPNSPTQSSSLSCATASSVDTDGDTLTFSYVWKKDGVVIGGQTSSSLGSSYLVHFSTYTCEATADDGHGGITMIVAANVTVQNTVPTGSIASGNATTQDVPAGGAIASITLGGSDSDGDTVTFVQTTGEATCPNITVDVNTGVISGRMQREDETPARSAQCSLGFRVKDQYNATSTADLVVTIASTNRAPTASCTNQTGNAGDTVTAGACTFGDADAGSALTYNVSGCGLGITVAGMLTGTIPAATCTATVTVSDGLLSTNTGITVTPYVSLALGGSNTLSNTCQLTVPGNATYAGGATYSSATGTSSLGGAVVATGTGLTSTISTPAAGNFNLSWTVNSAGPASSTTLNQTLSLTTQAVAQNVLQFMEPNAVAGRVVTSGSEPPKAGCGASCSSGYRGQIATNQAGTYCAITSTGGLACWGNNVKTETGMMQGSLTAVKVAGISGATKVHVGYKFACALLSNSVVCWGNNIYGQLGNNTFVDSATPVTVQGLTAPADLAVGLYHACALDGGAVKCWGAGSNYSLGNNSNTNQKVATLVAGLPADVTKVRVGNNTSCAMSPTVGMWCWGSNTNGQIGNDTTATATTPQRFRSTGDVLFSNVVDLAVATSHACAVLATGDVWCSGMNSSKQLGDRTTTASPKAVQVLSAAVTPLTNVVSVQIESGNFTCAKRSDLSLWCWGGEFGWNGNGTATYSTRDPAAIPGFAGGSPATTDWYLGSNTGGVRCAVSQSTHLAKCWGSNNTYGEIGNGTYAASSTATLVANLPTVAQVSTNLNSHSCAVTDTTGEVYCWGTNQSGALGYVSDTISTPTVVPGVSNVASVTLDAWGYTTVLLNDGTMKYWGGGTQATNATIQPVAEMPNGVAQLVATTGSSPTKCVILTSGGVKCWGNNAVGQIGDNTTTTRAAATDVLLGLAGGESVVSIAAGERHLCALIAPNGTVKCWGSNNNGQAGLLANTPVSQLTPSLVDGLSGVKALALGYRHSCALMSNGTVQCWGVNTSKQLWDGTTTSRHIPAAVSGISNAVAIHTGYNFTCATLANRAMTCWGSNSASGLGDANASCASGCIANVLNVGQGILSMAGGVSASYESACVLGGSGSIYCWGYNTRGEMGNGTIGSTSTYTTFPNIPAIGTFATWSNCSSYVLSL